MTTLVGTVILAGGKGTCIGGDKSLQLLRDKALIDWVLDAISKQSDEVPISANTNQNEYATRGCRIIAGVGNVCHSIDRSRRKVDVEAWLSSATASTCCRLHQRREAQAGRLIWQTEQSIAG